MSEAGASIDGGAAQAAAPRSAAASRSEHPASSEHVELRRGVYHDSVTLLRISQAVTDTEGVSAAQVGMATELNVQLAERLGFVIPDGAGPNDLLVAVRGGDDAAVATGLRALATALVAAEAASHQRMSSDVAPPRTVRGAALAAPDAPVVLLSVPGAAVIGEAMDAIAAGRNVMIFSDNVPVDHEIALKDAAAAAGVLVMGPDCGTALIGGVGLGFANVLGAGGADVPGAGGGSGGTGVGIIAASGTGAQHLSCLLDDAGVTISHIIGVGGRDLSAAVAGRSTLAALALFDADPGTGHIVIVSKPPHPEVAERVLRAAGRAGKPVTTVLLGTGQPDITAGAEAVLNALGLPVPAWGAWPAATATPAGALRGLFSGGTLADEAMLVAAQQLGDIRSNIPLRPDLALPLAALAHGLPDLCGLGHVVVDLGEDEFTRGRAHPMIDPTMRLDLLAAQAADPEVSVVLLDVVLGHGAEPDPAGRLAPAIAQALKGSGRPLAVVVSLCGTDRDPQVRSQQRAALVAAGASVYTSNAAAARAAAALAAGRAAGTEENR